MKKVAWVSTVFLTLCLLFVHISFAQEPTPIPTVPASTPTIDIEGRLNEMEVRISILEDKHDLVLSTSQERIEQLRTLLTWLGIVFVVLSAIFGGVAAVATWRQASQQQKLTGAGVEGAQSASKVLDVVHQILNSRLLQVPETREEIDKLKEQLEAVTSRVSRVTAGIAFQRELLESKAMKLAQTPRHDFKRPINVEALNDFAMDFDSFKKLYPEEGELSGRCQYIRGVAAIFNDQLQDLQYYLGRTTAREREHDESEISYLKRLANAYYYLGLFRSNLGELDEAVRFLGKAQEDLELPTTDFLTRLAMAEVYAMSGQRERAETLLREVEVGMNDLKASQRNALYRHQLRMLSRAHLMRANMAIIAGKEDWLEQAKQHTEEACRADPDYYYASLTLGQILREIEGGVDTEHAKELFRDAYAKIQRSEHLHFVKETRTRILLLMTSALCIKHGGEDEGTVASYLDEARSLRDDLPRIDDRVCTVFSPLSKRNVNSETIGSHVEMIREGTWSLHPE